MRELIYAAVWLVAIVAAWDMVRMVTRAARERAANVRVDALEAQIAEIRAAERLGELETQVKALGITLRNRVTSAGAPRAPAAPFAKNWGA
jgi:3'-phosphoadenosine 5'-phosphosulfate sulfotransferase